MTTDDDLPTGQPAATHRPSRGVSRLLLGLGLTAMAAIAQAQTAPAGVDAASTQASADVVVSPAPAPSKPVTTSVKEKAAEAARAGSDNTNGMLAKFGRARYIGERCLGHKDPGSVTFAYFYEGLAKGYSA